MGDIAAASAALLFNQFDEWAKLPDRERYERLRSFLEATLTAADEFRQRRLDPSEN